MPSENVETIQDRLLSEWQNLVLLFPKDRTDEEVAGTPLNHRTFKAYVFRVSMWNTLRRTDIDIGTLDPSSGVGYDTLEDASNDDYLRNEDQPWTMYHYSIGMKEDNVRIYPRAPSGQNGGGFTYLDAGEPSPLDGDEFGYIPGSRTDYHTPPTELENVAYATGSNVDIEYGFYNEASYVVDPTVSIVGRTYVTLPVTQEREKRRIVSGEIPRTMVSWGHAVRSLYSPSVPSIWSKSGNDIDIESGHIMNVQGGR